MSLVEIVSHMVMASFNEIFNYGRDYYTLTLDLSKTAASKFSFHTLIGRAKRAPHWGVQSRFRKIYIYVSVVG